MQLSVLIPTHDRTCYPLVSTLASQLQASGISHEVIVADDGSRDQVSVIANLKINEIEHCQYIRNTDNVGRSAIRNQLADKASGEWLLFIDSDAKIVRQDYINRYAEVMNDENNVVCGGIIHPDVCPSPRQSLRWTYEKDYELRNGTISEGFRSFQFMIRREVFMQIRFDERITKYGWEDVLFGIRLREMGLKITCIDNPLMNDDIERNDVFLRKTEEAIMNLCTFRDELKGDVNLIKTADMVSGVAWLLRMAFALTKNMMRRNLLGEKPNMKVLAFYKLGYYLNHCRKP